MDWSKESDRVWKKIAQYDLGGLSSQDKEVESSNESVKALQETLLLAAPLLAEQAKHKLGPSQANTLEQEIRQGAEKGALKKGKSDGLWGEGVNAAIEAANSLLESIGKKALPFIGLSFDKTPIAEVTNKAKTNLSSLRSSVMSLVNLERPDMSVTTTGPEESIKTVDVWGVPVEKEAAGQLQALMGHATVDLNKAIAKREVSPKTTIGISSGYRPTTRQFELWDKNFKKYYDETRAERAKAPGGPHKDAAKLILRHHIGGLLAAPGKSAHQQGRAVDFTTVHNGTKLYASSGQKDMWKHSWFYKWLVKNAGSYGFALHPPIAKKEPWHWVYKGAGGRVASAPPSSDLSPEKTKDMTDFKREVYKMHVA